MTDDRRRRLALVSVERRLDDCRRSGVPGQALLFDLTEDEQAEQVQRRWVKRSRRER